MKLFTTLLSLGLLTLAQLPLASAGTLPGSNIDNVTTYLNEYTNGYTELSSLDFYGKWQYTAIAYESGNTNTISLTENGTPTFSTASNASFGTWEDINFSSEQLFFEDSDGPSNVELDPFSAANSSYFRVFQLTADSDILNYLGNSFTLALGTIIVGFNDNGLGLGDADYDDMIVALKPVSAVPIPAAAFLFAPALLGFMGLRRKAKNIAA
tara:strand:+ start:83369 stop:84001 length:633 start_codon:yes stop_codon:yes gene_type:complete